MHFALFIALLACSDKTEGDTSTSVVDDNSDQAVEDLDVSGLSDCGQQVLEEGEPTAFDQCFEGSDVYGSCETCGYYPDVVLSQGEFDCITCEAGFEIDVEFDDCTGYCVPEGTAVQPIAGSDCVPVSECVLE